MNVSTSLLHRFFWVCFHLFALAVPSLLQASINDPTSINIGVLASGTKGQCFDQWRPTAEYLQSALPGYSVNIVCLEYREVEKVVYDGLVDFTITNPAIYVNLEFIFGASRIATLRDRQGPEVSAQFGGVLFTKADRKDIQTATALKGKRVAAVDPLSFGGWLVNWRYLKQHGIDPFKDFKELTFLRQHDTVVLAVLDGSFDAGSVRTGILEQMAEEGRINLKDFAVIDPQMADQSAALGISSAKQEDQAFPYVFTSLLYPHWALAKIQHVDTKLAERVMIAFLQMAPESEAARAAHLLGWTIPLDYSPVLECLKELKVGPYKYLDTPVSLYQLYRQYRYWVHGALALFLIILGGAALVLLLNRKLSLTLANLAREQKEKEKIVASLNEFKTTLDKTNDCVFIFDPKTLLFLYTNQGGLEQVGYSLEEMLTMTPLDIKPDFTEQQFRNLLAPLLDNTEKSIEFTTRHKSKQGDFIPVEIALQHVALADGTGRCVAIVRNITRRLADRKERDQLQARLLNEQKLASVGQLAAGIAHEINTPTQYLGSNITFLVEAFKDVDNLITGYDQLLATATSDPAPGDALLAQIAELKDQVDWDYLKNEIPKALEQSQEGIIKISTIVLAMKEFSHPGNKEKQQININRLIETTVTVTSNEWKYVAEIDKQLDEHLPLVLCLPNEIGQVFLNILVNATQAIAEKIGKAAEGGKGRITITSKALDDQIEITFTDTGGGIPAKIGDKVFDPFFTTKEVGRGTGQGLAISHDIIVKKHGGTLDFISTEGQGTTFIIRLPQVQ